MKIPKNLKCETCPKIFCCPQCRIRHEIKFHMASKKLISCPICCNTTPYPLHKSRHNDELLGHITREHLPLKCEKCMKIFEKVSDFDNTDACKRRDDLCQLQALKPVDIKENVHPDAQEKEEQIILLPKWSSGDPAAISNKPTNERSIIDSLSSIENISNNILHKTASPTRNLVRQTSTPMHRLMYKIKQSSFNSTGSSCQMSTINNSNSDTDISPPVRNKNDSFPIQSPTQKTVRSRNKMPVSATPLRQVMSKSIQKAIVQHGIPAYQKSIFSPGKASSMTPPLDLRTSAVLRRTKSCSSSDGSSSIGSDGIRSTNSQTSSSREFIAVMSESENNQNQMGSAKSTTDSSKCHLDTVYETCANIEHSDQTAEPKVLYQTPKTSGVLKRIGSFAERNKSSSGEDALAVNDVEKEDEDVWYTPITVPQRKNNHLDAKPNSSHIQLEINSIATNFESINCPGEPKPKTSNKNGGGGKLWSIVTSVMRLASFGSTSSEPETRNDLSANVTIKKWASFTGLGNKNETISSYKRRRTSTVNVPLTGSDSSEDFNIPKRIKGRMPIKRMRK